MVWLQQLMTSDYPPPLRPCIKFKIIPQPRSSRKTFTLSSSSWSQSLVCIKEPAHGAVHYRCTKAKNLRRALAKRGVGGQVGQNKLYNRHHRDHHHHHQGWRLCWRPCGRLHPQLPRGDHCHGGDCISRWIMKIIAAKIIVGILLIFRSRVEFNFAGLWGLWRSRPLLADWTKSKGGWRWCYMLMATLIFWGQN